MIIAVSGTPGTGKSRASKLFAKKIRYRRLDLNSAIRKRKLYSSYDRKRRTYVADMSKVRKFLKKYVKKSPDTVVDSHLSHNLRADKVIVLRCRPDVLAIRLRKKKWSRTKVQENMEAELIGVISYEARKRHKKVWEIDTTGRSPEQVANSMQSILKSKGKKYTRAIDWIQGKGLKG